MKKIALMLILVLLVTAFSACGSQGGGAPLDIAAASAAIDGVTDAEGYSIFGSLTAESTDTLKEFYGLDTALMEDYVIMTPLMNINACLYMLIVPKDGEKDNVKNMVNDFFVDYQQRWDAYLPEQAAYVHGRMETEIDGVLIYIVSPDNDAVLDAIRSTK